MALFEKHEVVWDEEKIKRFWDFISDKNDEEYFSKILGHEVVELVESKIKLNGNVLDYGCGPGFLFEPLLKKGVKCTGADFSEKSVLSANTKFKNDENYINSVVIESLPIGELKDRSFKYVFFLEAIEHLLFDQMEKTLGEIRRVLRDNGYVIITTQNNERLANNETICPDCGCIFHRMQHINTFDSKKLSKLMSKGGFTEIYCRSLNFRKSGLEAEFKKMYENVRDRVFGESKKKNLIYIGQKH